MAYFAVRNSLNPHKVISCGITYRQIVDKNSQDGEAVWVIEVATDEPHVTTSGTIPPYFIHLTNTVDVDAEIEKAVAAISRQVDWSPLVDDTMPPFVDWQEPTTYISRIHDDVRVSISERHPSMGIDASSLQMFINGTEVTNDLQISGDDYNYVLRWLPPYIVYEQVD